MDAALLGERWDSKARPVTKRFRSSLGIDFRVENQSKSHLIPTLRLPCKAPYTPLPVNAGESHHINIFSLKRG